MSKCLIKLYCNKDKERIAKQNMQRAISYHSESLATKSIVSFEHFKTLAQ